MLLLGTAAGSIAGAIILSNGSVAASFMLSRGSLGPVENWTLCLLSLSVGASVFCLRAMGGGGWAVSLKGVGTVVVPAVAMFLFGAKALFALAVLALFALPFMKRRGIGVSS